jgi:hypothetical protein
MLNIEQEAPNIPSRSGLRERQVGVMFGAMTKQPSSTAPEPAGLRQHLTDTRHSLLKLHKSLVDSERVSYEATVGSIRSPNHFLQLLTSDPWFAWLHPLSRLIVSMDELMDAKEPLTEAAVALLTTQARTLLMPSEEGEGFARHYYEAMQRDPDVVLSHGEAVKLLGAKGKGN